MSSPQLHIKLFQPNGVTRAIVFTALPTWDELANRVKSFFDIPENSVALTYVDADGDEVTLDSQPELHELFTTLPGDTDSTTLKFAVRDMRDLREGSSSEDSDHTMSSPSVQDDSESPVDRTADLVAGVDAAQAVNMSPGGFDSLRGRGGHRGGRGGGRGRCGGPVHGHRGLPRGPPGRPPADLPFPFVHGLPPRARGHIVSHGLPPPPMSHEMTRAHSAPPALYANAPEGMFPFEIFVDMGLSRERFPRSRSPSTSPSRSSTPNDGCDRRPHGHDHRQRHHVDNHRRHHHNVGHHHGHGQHQRGGPQHFGRGRGSAFAFDMRGGRGRGGFGGHGPFEHMRFEMFPDLQQHAFGFGGRGRDCLPPGFGARGRGLGSLGNPWAW
ncbi:uncharacterized protein B0H18DRAFT_1002368 [Fomitopsis serialis]|uniref:uncharacterized protein n=1 Tax=Fomitopsis serialis TaxID=139415 RepID=UPI0020089570|nr:uncharacterized protein B0H18DRAFT_1002368 [Neoantrodia serialis]KAH9927817.1 hypothetical protein B0H18DRAFT_1002368 [Neoantrodia serialis]